MQLVTVLRNVDERTVGKSRKRLLLQTEVVLVQKRPFFEAVKETFKAGACQERELLLAVDADVLVDKDVISKIVYYWGKAKEQVPKLSRLDFLVKDKFRGRVFAGCHLYNNEYSQQMLNFLDEVEYNPEEKRPESTSHAKFRKTLGLSSKDCKKIIVGKHDFEQYYKHIYAKYYNRAVRDHKSYDKIYRMIEIKWQANPKDYDFLIALKGMEHARNSKSATMKTDADQYFNITDLLETLGIKEKEPLDV